MTAQDTKHLHTRDDAKILIYVGWQHKKQGQQQIMFDNTVLC